jgi:cytochrome b561
MGHADNAGLSNNIQAGTLRRVPLAEKLMTEVKRYHPALVALHWAIAILVIAALSLGALVMVRIPNSSPHKLEALRSHMSGGTLILVLMLARLLLRRSTAHPVPAATGQPLLDRLAWLSHRFFYVAVIGMATSGIVMALQTRLPWVVFLGEGTLPADFWAFPVRVVHYGFSRLLMGLIALHVAGALYHTLVLRDGLLRRMFFGHRRAPAHLLTTAHRQPVSEVHS